MVPFGGASRRSPSRRAIMAATLHRSASHRVTVGTLCSLVGFGALAGCSREPGADPTVHRTPGLQLVLLSSGKQSRMPEALLVRPGAIAVDASGTVYVGDEGPIRIVMFDFTGSYIRTRFIEPAALREVFRIEQVPTNAPAFYGLDVDLCGRWWVLRTSGFTEGPTLFDAFASDGVYLGSPSIPTPLLERARWAVGRHVLAAIVDDGTGAPTLALYRIQPTDFGCQP